MAKQRSAGKKKRSRAARKALPQSDLRWLNALLVLCQVLRDNKISYGETPEALRETLYKLDNDKLFGFVAECLYMLLNPPKSPGDEPRPRLRIRKKRSSSTKKKTSRAKKRVPHR